MNQTSDSTSNIINEAKSGNLEGCSGNISTPKGTNSFDDKILKNSVNSVAHKPLHTSKAKPSTTNKSFASAAATSNIPNLNAHSSVNKATASSDLKLFY